MVLLTGDLTTWVPDPMLRLMLEPIILVQDPTFWPVPELKSLVRDPMLQEMVEPASAWTRHTDIASKIRLLVMVVVNMVPLHAILLINSLVKLARSLRSVDTDRTRLMLLLSQYAVLTQPR